MKRFLFSLTALALASGCATIPERIDPTQTSQALPHGITAGQARLVARLYPELADKAEPNDNLFISPLSLSEGLGLALLGARGQTEAEMRDFLGWDAASKPELMVKSYDRSLTQTGDDKVALSVANALWLSDEIAFLPNYLLEAKHGFGATTGQVDFGGDPDGSAETINGWVREQTRQRITRIVEANGFNDRTAAVLTNAVWFKAGWSVPFEDGSTGEFTRGDGSTRSVYMMERIAPMPYRETREGQVVQLPYGANGRFTMEVFLPKNRDILRRWERDLRSASFDLSMQGSDAKFDLGGTEERRILLRLPRFKARFDKSVKGALIAAGMPCAFNDTCADFGDMPLAEKQIPRANLPSAALPEWNRRWRDAIAIRVAAPTYSGYLAQAVELLDRLAPALDRVLNLIIRGKSVSDAQLTAMNSVHEAARELTPPAIASSVATGEGSGEFNANITKLQNLLFAGSADVCRRFHQLPEGAGAFIAWTADQIKSANEAETQEPWDLVGGVPASLGKIREILVRVRIIAGDAAGGTVHPGVSFATLLGKAKPNNALRLVGSVVDKRMTAARNELAASIQSQLEGDGVEALVHVVEDPDGNLPWPPSKVLIVIPLVSQMEIESHANATLAARQAVPNGIRLTVIPSIDGRLLPTRGVSGYETLLPLPEEANIWIEQLDLPAFRPEISPILNLAVAKASALQSMDRLNLGIAGRPRVELETRDKLEDEFASMRDLLVAKVDDLDPESSALALSLLDRIRSGEAGFADGVQEFTVSQVPNEIIQEVSGLQIALDDAEFERGRAGCRR